jgi:hypothetical protein
VNRETAERSTILRGLVGSTVHGLNVNDGIEDRDEMGTVLNYFVQATSRRSLIENSVPCVLHRRRKRRCWGGYTRGCPIVPFVSF